MDNANRFGPFWENTRLFPCVGISIRKQWSASKISFWGQHLCNLCHGKQLPFFVYLTLCHQQWDQLYICLFRWHPEQNSPSYGKLGRRGFWGVGYISILFQGHVHGCLEGSFRTSAPITRRGSPGLFIFNLAAHLTCRELFYTRNLRWAPLWAFGPTWLCPLCLWHLGYLTQTWPQFNHSAPAYTIFR